MSQRPLEDDDFCALAAAGAVSAADSSEVAVVAPGYRDFCVLAGPAYPRRAGSAVDSSKVAVVALDYRNF
ncbi:hypothetical protein [Rathayibacter sp. PhB127]|uniref:hypothetical protein n=1 Tax=Rathayibacter sp. PhB127 TaxID=2485176 RepID=UPI0011CEAFA4|nr:hypothetical protein [Rathayibacter sp. PhB127]